MAIFARTSPFLLTGLTGVVSVIAPVTFPSIYTLSKKMSLALCFLHELMVFCIIAGHWSVHIRISYFNPGHNTTTDEPFTASSVCAALVRSAGFVSAPFTALGLRLTKVYGTWL